MRNRNMGFLALLVVGGFYAWRNRFRIQRLLESRGIDVPLSTGSFGDTIRSGVAKVTGSAEHTGRQFEDETRKAV
jgi:hypothetical protein